MSDLISYQKLDRSSGETYLMTTINDTFEVDGVKYTKASAMEHVQPIMTLKPVEDPCSDYVEEFGHCGCWGDARVNMSVTVCETCWFADDPWGDSDSRYDAACELSNHVPMNHDHTLYV